MTRLSVKSHESLTKWDEAPSRDGGLPRQILKLPGVFVVVVVVVSVLFTSIKLKMFGLNPMNVEGAVGSPTEALSS